VVPDIQKSIALFEGSVLHPSALLIRIVLRQKCLYDIGGMILAVKND
jgi:hypothetical protein